MYQKDVKASNENMIFHTIYTLNTSFTIPELSKIVGMTFPTVKRIVDDFIDKNILMEWKLSSGSIGRRAVEYKYNPDFCNLVGLSIENKNIRIILMNSKAKIIASEYYPIDDEDIAKLILKNIKTFLKKIDKTEQEKILGIGISIPGIFSKENHFIEFELNKRYDEKIKQELEDELGYKIWIENEANMCVLAEAIIGEYYALENFTVIAINKTLSSSNYFKTSLKTNEYFFKASRTGYIPISEDEKKCFGDYLSLSAIENLIKKHCGQELSLNDFFSDAKYYESKEGKKVKDIIVKYLSILIKNTIFQFNPNKIIICGTLSKYKDILLPQLVERTYPENHIFYRGKETLTFSNFGGNANVIGAAIFPLVDTMM